MAFDWLKSAALKFTGAGSGAYDAVVPKGKRKPPTYRARSEDAELRGNERVLLASSTRDLQRNFSVAAWAIRKHLDYVSTFSFQSRTGIAALDDRIEALMTWWSRPLNCDAAARHSLARLIRLGECRRTVDGDVLFIERQDGKLQLVEGDRVRTPIGSPEGATSPPLTAEQNASVINGVILNPDGAAQGYCVHRRDKTGMLLAFDRVVPAAFAPLHGYFDRYDQVRGISPISAAVNQFRDVYESFDYTLAKEKVAQLFALAFYRENSDATGVVEATTESDGDGNEQNHYAVDFGRGPVVLDLDPGDRAEFLSSQNPSSESQAFWQFVIMTALKSLDIPYSFFDESHTNYSGLRVAWLMYDQSADIKRADNKELLNRLTAWRLSLFILDGELELPPGMKLSDLKWEWINKGIPWVDQMKEVSANIAAVAAGLADPQEILKAQGKDPFEVIDRIAEFNAYAKSKDVTLSYNVPPPSPPESPEDKQAGQAGGNNGKQDN